MDVPCPDDEVAIVDPVVRDVRLAAVEGARRHDVQGQRLAPAVDALRVDVAVGHRAAGPQVGPHHQELVMGIVVGDRRCELLVVQNLERELRRQCLAENGGHAEQADE